MSGDASKAVPVAGERGPPIAVTEEFPTPCHVTFHFSVQVLAGVPHAMCINLLSQAMDSFSHELTESERRGVAAWFTSTYGSTP